MELFSFVNKDPSLALSIDAHITDTGVLLTAIFRDDEQKSETRKYIYDRLKKRYYRLVPHKSKDNELIKRRISEEAFHQVFSQYLARR